MKLLLAFLAPVALYCADTSIRGFPPSALSQEKQWEEKARAAPQPDHIRQYIQRMSAGPHDAGSAGSKAVAEYLLGLLREWGMDASIEEFEALLPRPVSRGLEMLSPVNFQAKLQEPPVAEDKTSAEPGMLPTYNAYSPDGDVTAPLVYVNYGVPEDYDHLKKQGIDVKGKIVIARYGSSWRGVKPKVAFERGAVGCIIYSDPRDDGYFQGDTYPKGAYRPKDGVQRGSVMDMSVYPGDPLSPGWASEKGSRRLPLSEAKTLQKIPVLPVSWADARPLLENLEGPVAPEKWRGALPFTYHIGPGPAKVHLQLKFDWSTRPLYDVIARIPGSEFPDEWVIYGNHHDAWVHGASDPASGAAALLETARTLAGLYKQGWRPRRTILLTLWDGEEYGLIGSTEWAEKHATELQAKTVVYLNSDSNGKGKLGIGGSPTLEQFMAEVTRDVTDPKTGKSLFESAGAQRRSSDPPSSSDSEESGKEHKFEVGPLGSGSDYTAFVHHLGIASLNLGFSGPGNTGQYHSIYDSFYWYSHFSDPDFVYGRALAQVTSTALLRLANAPVLPFEFQHFAGAVVKYMKEIEKLDSNSKIDSKRVNSELEKMSKSAAAFNSKYEKSLNRAATASPERLKELNGNLFRSERVLTLAAGLPGREWFRNQIYAPGLYTGYGAKTLPAIRESIEAHNPEEAARGVENVLKVLRDLDSQIQAAGKSLGEL